MDYLLHGMTREELEATMFNLFQKADADGDGFLNRDEFRSCINDASLGLTRREVNLLMAEADEDEDGKVSYEEFVPLCFDLLLKNLQVSAIQTPFSLCYHDFQRWLTLF